MRHHQYLDRIKNRLPYLAIIGVLLYLAMPVEPPAHLTTATSFGPTRMGFTQEILPRAYTLLKSLILWVPVGTLYGLIGRQTSATIGGLLLAISGLLAAPFVGVSDGWRASLITECVAILPGLLVGTWLAARLPKFNEALTAEAVGKRVPRSSGRRHGRSDPHARSKRAAERLDASYIWLYRVLGLLILAIVAAAVLNFPRFQLPIGVGLALYALLLARYPNLWLFVLPASLPVFDLAFWTGRFFLDEFDMLLLTMLGARWVWGSWETGKATRGSRVLMCGITISVLTSLAIGLYPVPPVDANAFANYWSHYNGLRVAKGFVWGFIMYLWLRPVLGTPSMQWFAAGTVSGLGIVALLALREYWLFGFSGASAADYRATATFSSMHIGGGHIEIYLVIALPFVAELARLSASKQTKTLALIVLGFALAALVTTIARGGVLGTLAVMSILLAAAWRTSTKAGPHGSLRPGAVTAVVVGSLALLAAGITSNDFFRQRFIQTISDSHTRFEHWRDAMTLGGNSTTTVLFGHGLGAFPRAYLLAHPESPLGTYSFASSGAKHFLRLNSGGTLYVAQRIAIRPATDYKLQLDARSDGRSEKLEVSICEKVIFNSARCEWRDLSFPNDLAWNHLAIPVASDELGAGAWWQRRPLQISLYNPIEQTLVDIDNVRLTDPTGTDLIANGDFSAGGDHWFFNSGNHLAWHLKNMWVHLYFEQGFFGLLVFSALMATAVFRLTRRVWAGDATAAAWLASLAGILVLGVVDSILDTPRLTLLVILVLLVGASERTKGLAPTLSS